MKTSEKPKKVAVTKWANQPKAIIAPDTQAAIAGICDNIKKMILDKNRKYGDSALRPRRIFSKAGPIEQINVRIDDKISRILSAQDDDTEDAELDLIGYLILKQVARTIDGNKPKMRPILNASKNP
jgi:hypothetical protein